MISFGREPINLSGHPPLESIKWMMWFFQESFEERGESIELFDFPEIGAVGNSDLVKTLNNRLADNPDF